jgi:23S rRNA pseudouridine1911/1915/1917 synthase
VFLAALEPELSRSAAAGLARRGLVRVNGRVARPAEQVGEGDLVELTLLEPAATSPGAESISLDVVYDDSDLVVVNKPAGMVVHPAAGHASGTLVNALLGLGGGWSAAGGELRPGIVHRLDKGTSGLILAARNDFAHRHLAAQLAERSLVRVYLAIARPPVPGSGGILEGPIGRDPGNRKRMAVVDGGRPARTRYEVLESRGGHSLLRCRLETGRTHQIRVHLTAFGHPLAGDDVYGRRRPGDPDRPMLHAQSLQFRHPRTGQAMAFQVEPPSDFNAFWESLAGC